MPAAAPPRQVAPVPPARRGRVTATALAAVVAGLLVATWRWPEPAPAPAPRLPAATAAAPVPPALAPPPGPATAPGHVDDYSAPVEELVGHVDHLDLDRLPPDTRAALEAELQRREGLRTSLWEAYGGPAALPDALAALDAGELTYLLLAVRADRLAAAGGVPGLAAAQAAVGPEHPSVTVQADGACLRLQSTQDPYGRVFVALPGVAPGPLAERLAQSVRVTTDAAGCEGQPPAFTPAGLAALASLDLP